jgi:L-threonylcarbamoyladenylate synthase
VHLSDGRDWSLAASKMTPHAETLLAAFSPGPITVVLPKRANISPLVTAGLETVGVRIPNHVTARQILRKANLPIAAPSANRSGRPSSTTWKAVLEDLEGRIDAVFCEDSTSIGIESTVVDCCGPVPIVLRPGGITIEQLQAVIPDIEELDCRHDPTQHSLCGKVNSPGLLHPHYRPRAKVRLVDATSSGMIPANQTVAYCGIRPWETDEPLTLCRIFPTVEAYAAGFYEFLREVDRLGISIVIAQAAPAQGIGRALLDRQRRAASESS